MRTLSFDIEISDDTKYVAQDSDGEWFEYIRKPTHDIRFGHWSSLKSKLFILATKRPKNASLELYEVK